MAANGSEFRLMIRDALRPVSVALIVLVIIAMMKESQLLEEAVFQATHVDQRPHVHSSFVDRLEPTPSMEAPKDTLDDLSLETDFKLLQATLLHRRDPTQPTSTLSDLGPPYEYQPLKESMQVDQSFMSSGHLGASKLNHDNVTEKSSRTKIENYTSSINHFGQKDIDGIFDGSKVQHEPVQASRKSNIPRMSQSSVGWEVTGEIYPGSNNRRKRRHLESTSTSTSTSRGSNSSSSESHRQHYDGIRSRRVTPPRTPFTKGPRRVLIVGLEGSGASLLAQVLCQLPQSICIMRLLPGASVPTLADFSDVPTTSTIVLRATIGGSLSQDLGCKNFCTSTSSNRSECSSGSNNSDCYNGPPIAGSYVQLVASFQPHAAVLFVRHPLHNYAILRQRIHFVSQEDSVMGSNSNHHHGRSSSSSSSISSSSSNSKRISSNTQGSNSNRNTSCLTDAVSQVDGSMRLLERLYGRRKALFNTSIHLEELLLLRPILRPKFGLLGFSTAEVKHMLELTTPVHTLLQDTRANCQWCRNHFKASIRLSEEGDDSESHSGSIARSSRSIRSEDSSSIGALKRWDVGRSRFEITELPQPRLYDNNSSSYGYSILKHSNASALFNLKEAQSSNWSRPAMLLVRTLQLTPNLLAAYSHSTLSTANNAISAITARTVLLGSNNHPNSSISIHDAETTTAHPPSQADKFAATVEELLALVALRASHEKYIVLTFADNKWLDLLLNWMTCLHEVEVFNYVVLSVEAELHNWLLDRGAPSFYYTVQEFQRSDRASFRSQLWFHRWRLMGAVLEAGYHVLHSDADALWVANPFPLLFQRAPQAHIVAGRGANKQEWLVCMGWIFLRSAPPLLDLLPVFLKRIRALGDDQRALNLVLANTLQVKWNVNPYSGSGYDDLFVGKATKKPPKPSTDSSISRSGGTTTPFLSVMLLPNTVVRRFFCSDISAATTLLVLHCRDVIQSPSASVDKTTRTATASSTLTSSSSSSASSYTVRMGQSETAAGKAAGVKALGLWRLSDRWRTVRFPLQHLLAETDSSSTAAASIASHSLSSSSVVSSSATNATTTASKVSTNTSAASTVFAEGETNENSHVAYRRKRPLRSAVDATALKPWMALRQSTSSCRGRTHSMLWSDLIVGNVLGEYLVSRKVNDGDHNPMWPVSVLENHFRHWLKAICVGCVEVVANSSRSLLSW